MKAFISHISEEARVAAALKETLNRDFLGMLDVFVSSDGESIAAGDDWLNSIYEALHSSSLLITLCSPTSIHRTWVHFEVGAAWMHKVPIIPICHAGLTLDDLRMPLSRLQGLRLDNGPHLQQLYNRIADILSCRTPERSFENLATELSGLNMSMEASRQDDLRRIEDDRGIGNRLRGALNNPRYKWRSLERIAFEAGVSEEVAADLLRANDEVRFSKGKTGNIIVGLRSRVD